MLENDEITLTFLKLHLLFKSSAESVKRVTTGSDGGVRENTDPLETSNDSVLVFGVLELGLGRNGPDQILFFSRAAAQNLSKGFLPRKRLIGRSKEVLRLLRKETNVDEDLDELGEALESEGTTDDGVSFRNIVSLLVTSRISVGVGNKSKTGINEVWLSSAHKILRSDIDDLAILPVSGTVSEGKEDTTGRPRKLVTQWVIRVFGSRETTAVRKKALDLTTSLVNFVNGLDSVKVIDTRVQTDFVKDNDSGLLGFGLKLKHGRAGVRSGDDVLLVSDGRLDNMGVIDIGNQRDDEVVLSDFSVKGLFVIDVKRDGLGL